MPQQNLALLIALALKDRLEQPCFGLLARNMPQFDPKLLYGAMQTALEARELRLALIGYKLDVPFDPEQLTLNVEQVVAWRNDNSTKPIVAILNPLDMPEKIHSLELLEPFTDAELRRSIVNRGMVDSKNPTERAFWRTLKRKDLSERLALAAEQVAQLYLSWKQGTTIEDALPHIDLLRDPDLFAKGDASEKIVQRLTENAQIVSRLRLPNKKDYRALGRALDLEQKGFQNTFLAIQAFTQRPHFDTLNAEALSVPAVEALFKAPKAPEAKVEDDTSSTEAPPDVDTARQLLGWMFSQDDTQRQQLNDFAEDINDLFEEDASSDQEPKWEEEKEGQSVSTIAANGQAATVTYPEKSQRHCLETIMRQAVQNDVWGGVLDTQDLDINLAVPLFFTTSVPLPPLHQFKPIQSTSLDDKHSASLLTLVEALDQYRSQSDAELLTPLLHDLYQKRQSLTPYRIRFLYRPDESAQYVLPTSSDKLLTQISEYIEAYEQFARRLQTLYRQLFDLYPDTIKQATAQFLALDTIIILRPIDLHTRQRRDAVVLTTLHPLYLWKWLDLAQRIQQHDQPLSKAEAEFLQERLLRLPTVLNTFTLYSAMLPTDYASARPEGEELRLVLAGEVDQPRNERTAGVPYYQQVSEPSTSSGGLPSDQLSELLKTFLALYPPARVGISITVVNPPALKPLLDACRKLADATLLCGAHIYVLYTNEQVDLYEARLFDDDVFERFRNSTHWTIITGVYQNYEKLTQAVREQFFHLTLLYNPSEAIVQPVLSTTRAQTSPFSIPLQLTYDPIRDTVRRVPAPVGGIFDVYTGLRNAVSNELSHRTYGVGRRPIKERELRALAEQSAWMIVLDHINGTLEQPIGGAVWLWQPAGTQTLTVSSQDNRWQVHLDDLVRTFAVPWPRDRLERYVREILSLVPQGLLGTVQPPSDDEETAMPQVASGDAFQQLLAIVGTLHYYRDQHPNAILIPLQALDLNQAFVSAKQSREPAVLTIWYDEEHLYIDIVATRIISFPDQLPDLSAEEKSLASLDAIARVLESIFNSQAENTLFGPLRREMLRDYLSVAVFAPTSSELLPEERKLRAQNKAAWADVINKLFLYSPQIRLRSIRILLQGRPTSLQILPSDSYRREVVTLSVGIFGEVSPQPEQSPAEPIATQSEEPVAVYKSPDTESQNKDAKDAAVDSKEEPTEQPAKEVAYAVEEPIEEQAQQLRRALVAYGIAVAEVDTQRTQVGPRIIRFWVRLQPPAGRLSEVQKYIVDIARELGSKTIPLVDNIPGEQYIRIDLPREHPQNIPLMHGLAELPQAQPASLMLATGVNTAGERIQHDLVRMPHLLVAGTTGSGKTMFLSTLITSLALRHSPADLQLMLVDPKQTDFVVFDRLPHLRKGRIIYDAAEAIAMLRTILNEDLDARTKLLAQARCPNNLEYNRRFPSQRIPWLVIVVDEFADIMLTLARQERETFERQIGRLAAIGRAKGIHLVLATQRPTTDVITGTIKANIPARISFRLPSLTDSRTILDQGGAEHLLGQGDMLAFIDGEMQRLQGYYAPYDEFEGSLTSVSD